MRTDCIPFSEIPHTSRLFLDFLANSPNLKPFYPHSPHFRKWIAAEADTISYDKARRQVVTNVLERQNRAFGSSEKTLGNLDRLRAGAYTVVTGQQVGLFGGPLFAILKAISAVKIAAEATEMGINCVPVFWLATEDHDLAEINHTSVIGADGALHQLRTAASGEEDAPVGSITFGDEITSVIDELTTLIGPSPVTDILKESYRPGEDFGSAFGKLFARIFAEWGVILLDPKDDELHQIARSVFTAAVERADAINHELLERGKALERAGYEEQVKVTPNSSLLFAFENGQRLPIRHHDGTFFYGKHEFSADQMKSKVAEHPERFSANVLLRPVMEDFLLPNLAYIGGAAEVAYFAQVGVVYQQILGRVTPALPRYSATIVEPRQANLLRKYHLSFTDLLHGSDHLSEVLAARTLDQELIREFENATAQVDASMKRIGENLQQLDPTLVDAAEKAQAKMQYQIEQLQGRAARAQARRTEEIKRHAELLSATLHPEKTLQEREVAGIYFVARHGLDFLHVLYNAVQTDCTGHHVLYLEP